MRKVKFVTMMLAVSLLTACGSSKKEQSVNEETACCTYAGNGEITG